MKMMKQGPATQKLDELAKAHAEKFNVDFYAAYDQVAQHNPELAKRAVNEVPTIVKTAGPKGPTGLPSSLPTPMVPNRRRHEIEKELAEVNIDLEHPDAAFARGLHMHKASLEMELDCLDDAQEQSIAKAQFTKQLEAAQERLTEARRAGDEELAAAAQTAVEGAKMRLNFAESDAGASARKDISERDFPDRDDREGSGEIDRQAMLDRLDADAIRKYATTDTKRYEVLAKLRGMQAECLMMIEGMDIGGVGWDDYTKEEQDSYTDTADYYEDELTKVRPLIDELRQDLGYDAAA